jgi:hypothetical protein
MRNPSHLNVRENPLSEIAINEQIPVLKTRGVYVEY